MKLNVSSTRHQPVLSMIPDLRTCNTHEIWIPKYVVDGPRDEYQTDAAIANVQQNYADQSLNRRQKLIAMRLGTRFFIYGMNGSKILLQMHTLIYGLTSHAKTTGIWLGMLPLYLHAGGHAYTSVQ